MKRAVIPLPNRDFDPTEVAVPWRALRAAGVAVLFFTPDGGPAACDPLVLDGVIFGQLGALPANVAQYRELEKDPLFSAPGTYAEIPDDADLMVLPGGHAKGMIPYLENEILLEKVASRVSAGRLVGAICHGVIVLARAINRSTGRSVLEGRRVTALPRRMERAAWLLTAWKMGDYYRTYPEWVQDEVTDAVGDTGEFHAGPLLATYSNPFMVEDGRLLTARWPGDASGFARRLVAMLDSA